jgi:hypothetical protein
MTLEKAQRTQICFNAGTMALIFPEKFLPLWYYHLATVLMSQWQQKGRILYLWENNRCNTHTVLSSVLIYYNVLLHSFVIIRQYMRTLFIDINMLKILWKLALNCATCKPWFLELSYGICHWTQQDFSSLQLWTQFMMCPGVWSNSVNTKIFLRLYIRFRFYK